MGRKKNSYMPTPLADATNTNKDDKEEIFGTPEPPKGCSSKPKTTEQIEAKRARERARYAKGHPIQKSALKDSPMLSQLKNATPVSKQSSALQEIPPESGPIKDSPMPPQLKNATPFLQCNEVVQLPVIDESDHLTGTSAMDRCVVGLTEPVCEQSSDLHEISPESVQA